tara:strand:- start:105 stop:605 length:501 start_codon:yes stop_codon:yes gene_type:complete
MFIILPDHVPSLVCSDMISIYENNKHSANVWRDTKALNLEDISNQEELNRCKRAIKYVNNAAVSFFGSDTYIELAEIVKWPTGSHQAPHTDVSRESTTYTSVTYLNDDFQGGETDFTTENFSVKPKVGRTILFDGKRFEHGVKKITEGVRYTFALWYSNNIMDCLV